VHLKLRNYECNIPGCERGPGNGFSRRDHLKQHKKKVHGIALISGNAAHNFTSDILDDGPTLQHAGLSTHHQPEYNAEFFRNTHLSAGSLSNQFAENYQTGLNAGFQADGTGMLNSYPFNYIQAEGVLQQTQGAGSNGVSSVPLQPLLGQYYMQQSGEAYSEQSVVQSSGLTWTGWSDNIMMTSGQISVRDMFQQPQVIGTSLPALINQYTPQQLAQLIPQDYDQNIVWSPRLTETSWDGNTNLPHN
jgi:hypothetical protein